MALIGRVAARAGHPASATSTADWRAFWLMMLAALLVLGAGIGLRDPWPSDEPRFALVARQMVESGDWLFPHRGSELYSDKPPMLMWLQALSYQLVGNWRIAFLLPSLLAGLLTLALTWDLGRRMWNPRIGLVGAVALLASFQFVFQFKRAQIDPLVTALITLANWALLMHLVEGPNWRAWYLGCFAAGLGVITKGVGVVALLLLVPYGFARWRQWRGVATPVDGAGWRWAAGGAAFLAAIAMWLVPMLLVAQARGGAEYAAYVDDILLRQTAARYSGAVGGHDQPFWYYLPVLLLHFFPLSLVYASAARRWWTGLRTGDARYLLLLGWCTLVLVFFSLAGGKREVYLMPMLPLLSLALAPTLEQALRTRWLRATAFASAVLLGLALAGGGWWALQGQWARMNTLVADRELADGGRSLVLMLLAAGGCFLLAAAIGRPRRGVVALLSGITTFWVLWGVWAAPVLNDANSAAGVMRRAAWVAGPDGETGLVAWKEQNLLMAQGPVVDFGFKRPWPQQFAQALAWQAEAPGGRWIFALQDAVTPCVRLDEAQQVGQANRRQWLMFRAHAVVPGCTPEPRPDAERWDHPAATED